MQRLHRHLGAFGRADVRLRLPPVCENIVSSLPQAINLFAALRLLSFVMPRILGGHYAAHAAKLGPDNQACVLCVTARGPLGFVSGHWRSAAKAQSIAVTLAFCTDGYSPQQADLRRRRRHQAPGA